MHTTRSSIIGSLLVLLAATSLIDAAWFPRAAFAQPLDDGTGVSSAPSRVIRGGTMKLRDICRLKGQEINVLQGLGLVAGLKGTGDPKTKPTARALARMMQLMGGQMSTDAKGKLLIEDVADSTNVALAFVTVRLPPVGAQSGDRLDCTVSAINAKSLDGGYLMLTPLLGPRSDQSTVYALAEGPLMVSEGTPPTTARIDAGAKMEASVQAEFEKDGKITLILDRDFADFDTAQRIEDDIAESADIKYGSQGVEGGNAGDQRVRVRAIDQLHIEVEIPEVYRDAPIKFISYLLDSNVSLPQKDSRVVINEREGVVVIGEDVRIPPVAITHRGLKIDATRTSRFVDVDSQAAAGQENPRLKNLVAALNKLDVPTPELIAIIKALKAKGDLYGEVIYQ
jgi:flagellar P-ring protein FlgI